MNSSDDNPPPRGAATTCPPPVAPSRPSEPLAGEVLGGSYRLLSPLGEGGMASVWLAEHLRTGGTLAVKLIHARLLASPRAAQRFALEARHTASLHHPNIVRVFDYGHDVDLRLLYQAMEYVPGETLADVVHRDGPMPWTRAVPILEQVLAALIAAHESERSLIHRDIKPANILLTDFEGQPGDTVKVVDFGISRALSGVRSTPAGAVIGSPSTMAPEQWQSKPVSPATDLYALGCTAYAMLAARVPFAGELAQLAFQHNHATPPPLAALAREETPAALIAWVGWLMRKDPARRPQRARQALEALRHVRDGRSFADLDGIGDDTMESAPKPQAEVKLPTFRSSFVGRALDMARLNTLVQEGAQLVTVRGVGGLGKSRLAVEWARMAVDVFTGGVFFCDLAEARSTQALCIEVARVLDLPLGQGDPVRTLGHALGSRGATLVILDNFEQLVSAAPALSAWLDAAPEVMFVVTSRQALRLEGERVVDVQPLGTRGDGSEAVELFIERARQVRPSYVPSDEARAAIAELVTALDGLPLAIELAAARARAMSPTRMTSRLSQRFKLLRSTRRDAIDRQATLEATLNWSWELLEPVEKAVFIQCAVFQGSFSLEAAEAVIDLSMFPEDPWVVDLLESLVDKSLIRLSSKGRDEERYAMFLSVHEYAAARLKEGLVAPDGEVRDRAVRGRHLDFYAPYGEREFVERVGRERRTLDELVLERDNLNVALDAALALGRPQGAERCALALCAALEHRGPYSEGLALIDRVLAVEPPEDALRARLLISAGTLARSAGQPERALERFEAALRLARALNLEWLQSRALFGLGAVQRVLGQREEAQQSYERSLTLGRQLGDKVLEGQALYGLGFVWRDMGQTERALEAFQGCQRLAHKARHLLLEGSALQGIGWMHGDLGRLEQARESYLACQQIARAIGHKLLEGSVLSGQGYVLKDQGRPGQALNAFAACLKLSREIGHTSLEATTLHGLGTVLADQGLWADAEDRYRACVRLSHGAGLKHVECYALSGLGYILMVQGRLDEARSAYASCVEQAQAVGHRFIEGDALAGLLASQIDLGRLDDALQTAQTLLALAEDADIPDLKTMAQLGLGRVRLAEGQLVGASDALARAAQQVRDSGNEPLMMEVGLAQADAALHQRDAAEAADLLASLLPLIDLDLHPLQALEHDALSALQLHLSGGAPRAALERAQEAVAELGLGPRSRLARLVERVRAAVAEG